MRFKDLRQALFKRIPGIDVPYLPHPEDADIPPATPRRLSPYRGGESLRPGIDPKDIVQPAANRASRRRSGMVKPRNRLPGMALQEKPWKR